MNKLQKIIAYFCVKYPHKGELSKARLTKLVYLADWFSALIDDRQLTDIDWLFNHYGPYVDDVVEVASRSPYFSIVSEQTMYGSDKYLISFNGYFDENSLPYRERQILDFVINKTKHLYFNDFIDYVYSTYPVESRNRYSRLDLVSLAREYNDLTSN
ncbi:Panacea domain-containing protein [Aeromonas caviae]|uniref:Panacea domain-containing protein n=1 Tax=Aeromonas caviae TaxID=648 RepID=UPI0029D911C2|nr:Panacea domain-containing protein [Aeromonas caviae]MDX7827491.1 Panacea domain-containing protein [Aeromonas caviae]